VFIGDQAGRLSERSEFGQTPNKHANAGESGKAGPPPFPPTQAPALAESHTEPPPATGTKKTAQLNGRFFTAGRETGG